MKKITAISAVCAIAISAYASDLGTIQVESSTIDDKFALTNQDVSSSTTITGEEVDKLAPTNIEDILNTVPGITASNVGNDRVKIHIRGIDNQMYMGEKPGVAVVIDGVPVQETTGKINLDLDNIASVKVIKGSASYLYGNDAIAGAIVITTKRPKALDGSKVETQVGSFGFKRVLASTNQKFETGALQLQATVRETDGYWDDAYLKHKSINGKYQYYLTDSSDLTFGLDYTTRETGDGTSIHGKTESLDNPKSNTEVSYAGYYDTTLLKTFLTYSNDIDSKSNLMVNISRYQDDTTNLASPTDTDSDGIKDDHKNFSDEEWIQNALKGEYRRSFDKMAIMAGLNLERNGQDAKTTANLSVPGTMWSPAVTKGDLLSKSNNKEDINAVYFEVKNELTKDLTSTVNFRYDNIKYDYTNDLNSSLDTKPSYDASTYRIGFNYKLDKKHSLYTSYATGFRAPSAQQISDNKEAKLEDPSLDIQTELNIENTSNIELGIRGSISSLKYDASIYQLNRTDYIGIRAGSYMWSSDDDADMSVGNLGDMRSRGFELALNSDREKMYSFSAAYTYLDAILEKYTINPNDGGQPPINLDGNTVPRTSKHTLNLIVDIKPIKDLTVSTQLTAKSKYFADEANEYEQPGYGVVNLRAEYTISDNFEVFAKVENLLDKLHNQFVSVGYGEDMTDATIRVAPPRAYYAGLRAKF